MFYKKQIYKIFTINLTLIILLLNQLLFILNYYYLVNALKINSRKEKKKALETEEMINENGVRHERLEVKNEL